MNVLCQKWKFFFAGAWDVECSNLSEEVVSDGHTVVAPGFVLHGKSSVWKSGFRPLILIGSCSPSCSLGYVVAQAGLGIFQKAWTPVYWRTPRWEKKLRDLTNVAGGWKSVRTGTSLWSRRKRFHWLDELSSPYFTKVMQNTCHGHPIVWKAALSFKYVDKLELEEIRRVQVQKIRPPKLHVVFFFPPPRIFRTKQKFRRFSNSAKNRAGAFHGVNISRKFLGSQKNGVIIW